MLVGIPAVAQGVKNLTVQVAEEAWVQSPAWRNRLKDPTLPQLRLRLQLRLGFSSWPPNFHMCVALKMYVC